jgi:hypothetical protein
MMSLAAAGTGVGLWTRNFRADNPAVVAAPAADPTKPPAAVAALPPTAVVAQDPSKPPVHGRVLDPDGKPVAGTKLFLPANQASITGMIAQLFSPRAVAMSDTDGRFAFTAESPPRGQGSLLPVIAVAAGFGPDWADATKPAANGELTLRLVADDGPIRGRVVDLEGRPVPGATAAADPKLLLDSRPVEGIIVAKANRAMNSPRYSAADCLIPPA